MVIENYIQEKRTIVSKFLNAFLNSSALTALSPVGKWGNDAVRRIGHFALAGKMLRSALVYLGADSCSATYDQDTMLKTAAAIELFQTGLIIHDDVMDNDESRRGLDSIHIQYQKIFHSDALLNQHKTAESFAVCSGNISFFLAYRLLGAIIPMISQEKVVSCISNELAKVCVAQMQDVYGGNTNKQFSEKEILSMYSYKTGRYSCALPLVLGGMIAGASQSTLSHFWKLGTALGICFQIKDDELNLFGNTVQTGKPTGSDIREGKQTLYRYFLMKKVPQDQKKHVESLFGNPMLTSDDILYITNLIRDLRIYKDIEQIIHTQTQTIHDMIHIIPMKNFSIYILEFLEYQQMRNK